MINQGFLVPGRITRAITVVSITLVLYSSLATATAQNPGVHTPVSQTPLQSPASQISMQSLALHPRTSQLPVSQPPASQSGAAQPPNIIYIMADDMGFADISIYGRKGYQTPNLDKLAAQGMRFTNAYAAAPVCTPTRVGFMTGRYPARLKIGLLEPWIPSPRDRAIGLSPDDFPVSMALHNAGYETALIGK